MEAYANTTNFIDCSKNESLVLTFPNPTNCSKYFQCENGTQIEMSCILSQHYNRALKTCDDPAYAGCHTNETSTLEKNSTIPHLLHNSTLNLTSIQDQNTTVRNIETNGTTAPTPTSPIPNHNLPVPEVIKSLASDANQTNITRTYVSSNPNFTLTNSSNDNLFHTTTVTYNSSSSIDTDANSTTFVSPDLNTTSSNNASTPLPRNSIKVSKIPQVTDKSVVQILSGEDIRVKGKNNNETADAEERTELNDNGGDDGNEKNTTQKP